MTIRIAAKNFALEYLSRRADEEGGQFSYNDEKAVRAVVSDLERALSEDDTRDGMLREFALAGLRDADRQLTQHRVGETMLLGQTSITIDYDPDELLVLGDTQRVKLAFSRYEHYDLNNIVEVDNKIAQDAAFARKMQRNHAIQDALRPLSADTTLGMIVQPLNEEDAA